MKNNALTALGILVTVAACGYDSPKPSAIDDSVSSAISAEDANVIVVNISDPLPVKSARLIDPAGIATDAFAIDTSRNTYFERRSGSYGPNVGVGIGGGSNGGVSTGIGIGIPLFGSGSSSGSSTTHLVTDSRIRVRVNDMAAYRANWQRYKLAVDLDNGVRRRSFEMTPPAPR